YGEKNPNLIQEIPKGQFPEPSELQVGMQFQADTPDGPMILTILEINESNVKVDGNHPLAGQALHFEVEVMELREATDEEIQHGHVHGEGGVQH
ncbi:peptidylprolyl isomerase, partial [Bacteriovoracales bacterium]|nr:peptidylprolyl isomerase [Bacteriovoracales bacterium]